jgi:O-antigen/teichoic acid export membrane protein
MDNKIADAAADDPASLLAPPWHGPATALNLDAPAADPAAPLPSPPPPAPADGADAPAQDRAVKKAAVSGAVWTLAGHVATQGARFGFNLVLTRLLAPRFFGIMALVDLFIQGIHMFSDLGIRQCVVQSKRGDDPAFLDTAWTLQVIRGLGLWACSWLVAWPAAAFYETPALLWLIPLAGGVAALNGFNSTTMLTFSRKLLRGRLVLIEVVSYVFTMSCVVGWIVFSGDQNESHRLLAMVCGGLMGGVIELAASYFFLPGRRPWFRWDATARRELAHFGGWVFLSTACTYLASQADRLAVGKLFTVDVLGVYQIADRLVEIPAFVMFSLGSQLVFPLYSRLIQAGRDLGDVFGRVHRTFTSFGALLIGGLVVAGPALVSCLYDERYHDAGRYLQLLGMAGWFTVLQSAGELVLLARGQTRRLAAGQATRLLVLPGALLVGFWLGGLPGLIIGYGSAEVVRYGVTVWFIRREGLPVLRTDVSTTALLVGVCAAAAALSGALTPGLSKWPQLFLDSGLVVGLWAVAFPLRRSIVGAAARLWGRLRPAPACVPGEDQA